jgi:hypothetical protein
MSDLQSTQPCQIKVTNFVSNSDRADVKALENAKTGKVTVVVVAMHLYGKAKSRSINSWVRCRQCSDCKAQGASGNYKAWRGSGDYEAWGASGGKYKA